MSKKSSRAARRAAREAKRRRDRNRRLLLVGAITVVMIAAIVLPVYFTVLRSSPADTTPNTGLQIENLVIGEGAEAQAGKIVAVDYTGWLEDGTQFDSSIGREPYTFTLGEGRVIEGWDQGIVGMKVGGKRKLIIPPDMAYGEAGSDSVVPPNATLIFEVELVAVQ